MANEMALAYIGKMLGQMGSALAGNNQNLQNYGSQATMSNEQLLADLHQKQYEEEKKKQEEKGLFGDILNVAGTAASVAFPAAAPVIMPVTGAASGAIKGGTGGAVAGGLSGGLQGMQAKGGDGATAGSDIVVQGDPVPEAKSNLFSTIMSDPRIQEGITGIANKMSTPSKPHLSTAGLYPETASNLRQQNMQQENADRQYQMEQQQSQERTAYYKQNQAMDREKLDFEKAQATAKANAPNSITTNELLRLEDGGVGTGSISPNGQVNIQPVPGVTLPEKANTDPVINLGGLNIPRSAIMKELETVQSGNPDLSEYQAMQLLGLENAEMMAQYKPQLPYMVNQGDQITAIPRNGQGTPTTIPVPSSPRQAAADQRAIEDQNLQRETFERTKAAATQDVGDQKKAELRTTIEPIFTQQIGPNKFTTNKADVETVLTELDNFIEADILQFENQVGRPATQPTVVTNKAGQKGLRVDWQHPDGMVETIVITNLESFSEEQ